MSRNNAEIVRTMIESFNAGELEKVLSLMAPDIDFREPGPQEYMPWVKPRCGRDQVREYLGEILSHLNIKPLEIRKVISEGDQVVVVGYSWMEVLANRRTAEVEFVMIFEMRDGLCVRYRNYYDTHVYVAAIRGE